MTEKLKIKYALCLFKLLFATKGDTKRTLNNMRYAMHIWKDRHMTAKQAFMFEAEPEFALIEHENMCHFSNKEKEEVMEYLYKQIGKSLEKALGCLRNESK